MGLRFRRTIRVMPGVRLNLSRSGISTSVGVRGAHVTVGHGRMRETVGLPGSGLSYTQSRSLEHRDEAPEARRPRRWPRILLITFLVLFVLPIVIGSIVNLF